MRSFIAIAALVASISAFAEAQVPNVFEDGTPATAADVNENFQYVLENASGGCSVEQVNNTAEITCADGTTAVVPGYGTVVVVPEGEIGEAPPDTLPTGTVVWADANGTVLAEVFTSGIFNYANLGLNPTGVEIVGVLFNIDATESVALSAFAGTFVYYVDSDCSGPPYGWRATYPYSLIEIDGRFLTPSARVGDGVLMRGKRDGAYFDDRSQQLITTGDCVETEAVVPAYALSQYTPAPEILNAAYPVRLEQLP